MAIRIPGPETIGGAENMTPQGPSFRLTPRQSAVAYRTSGGGWNRSAGARRCGCESRGTGPFAGLSLAEAEYMRGMINLKNELSQNNDYTTLGQLADTGSTGRDDRARPRRSPTPSSASRGSKRPRLKCLGFLDDVQTRAIGLQHDEALANFQTSLDAQLVSAQDSTIPRDQRQAAVDAGLGSLQRAKDIGLITPGQFITQRDDFLTKG